MKLIFGINFTAALSYALPQDSMQTATSSFNINAARESKLPWIEQPDGVGCIEAMDSMLNLPSPSHEIIEDACGTGIFCAALDPQLSIMENDIQGQAAQDSCRLLLLRDISDSSQDSELQSVSNVSGRMN
ncbi:hypothetical protein MY8738_009591 [Beauveria namnaoensis]